MRITEDTFGMEKLALLAFFATMPLYSPNVVPLQQCINDTGIMGALINAMMATCIVSAFAFLVVSLANPHALETRWRIVNITGCFTYLGGMAPFLGMASGIIPKNLIVAACTGCLLGVGVSILAIQWGSRLSSFNLKQALLLTCVICGSTAAANWVFSFLPSTPLVLITAALTVFGALYPVVASPHLGSQNNFAENAVGTGDESPDEMPHFAQRRMESADESVSTRASEPYSRRHMLKRFASVLLPALIGLSMFAFFMGVSRVTVLGGLHAEVPGNMIAGLLLAPLYFIVSRRPFITTLYRIVIPLASCAILCATVLAYDFGFVAYFIPLASYVFFCGIAQISLSLGVASMKAQEFPPALTWSFYVLLFSAFSALGLSFGSPHSYEEASFVSSSSLALYCTYLIAHALIAFVKEASAEHAPEKKSQDGDSRFEQQCNKLAHDYALSPREREILAYLGRGHTSAYIAKCLIISESTVYTHTRNIYRKMGVGSKEDIIQILLAEH